MALQQLGTFAQRQSVTEAERTCVLRGGLAVSAQRRGVGGRGGREVENSVGVARSFGMVGEPGEVEGAARWVGERRQRPPVQADLSVEHHRLLDGEARELVAERHA